MEPNDGSHGGAPPEMLPGTTTDDPAAPPPQPQPHPPACPTTSAATDYAPPEMPLKTTTDDPAAAPPQSHNPPPARPATSATTDYAPPEMQLKTTTDDPAAAPPQPQPRPLPPATSSAAADDGSDPQPPASIADDGPEMLAALHAFGLATAEEVFEAEAAAMEVEEDLEPKPAAAAVEPHEAPAKLKRARGPSPKHPAPPPKTISAVTYATEEKKKKKRRSSSSSSSEVSTPPFSRRTRRRMNPSSKTALLKQQREYVKSLEDLAEAGDAESQIDLAKMLCVGRGVQRDKKRGMQLLDSVVESEAGEVAENLVQQAKFYQLLYSGTQHDPAEKRRQNYLELAKLNLVPLAQVAAGQYQKELGNYERANELFSSARDRSKSHPLVDYEYVHGMLLEWCLKPKYKGSFAKMMLDINTTLLQSMKLLLKRSAEEWAVMLCGTGINKAAWLLYQFANMEKDEDEAEKWLSLLARSGSEGATAKLVEQLLLQGRAKEALPYFRWLTGGQIFEWVDRSTVFYFTERQHLETNDFVAQHSE